MTTIPTLSGISTSRLLVDLSKRVTALEEEDLTTNETIDDILERLAIVEAVAEMGLSLPGIHGWVYPLFEIGVNGRIFSVTPNMSQSASELWFLNTASAGASVVDAILVFYFENLTVGKTYLLDMILQCPNNTTQHMNGLVTLGIGTSSAAFVQVGSIDCQMARDVSGGSTSTLRGTMYNSTISTNFNLPFSYQFEATSTTHFFELACRTSSVPAWVGVQHKRLAGRGNIFLRKLN